MKKFLIFIMVMLLSSSIHAQTWDEWMKQKKTQIKYLLEQIIALGVYGKQLKTGYDIVQQGLSTIYSLKQGDFSMHEDFFSSLKRVNPNISEYAKISSIIIMQTRIIRQTKSLIKEIHVCEQLNKGEMEYLDRVVKGLLDHCLTTVDELSTIITKDKLELKDDERIRRIDTLYADMQDYYQFSQIIQKEITVIAAQRMREHKEVNQSRFLYGIK